MLFKNCFQIVENDAKEPPLYIGCLEDTHTHTHKDGTFLDYRAEEIVTQTEMKATQLTEESKRNISSFTRPVKHSI